MEDDFSKIRIDITGEKYGRLTVLCPSHRDKYGKIVWKCICDCQKNKPENQIKYTYTTKSNLDRGVNPNKNGGTKSCGCLHDELVGERSKNNKKYNKYDLNTYDFGVGYCKDGYMFYFDKEDYDLIKKYTWHKHQDGYIRTVYETYKDENGKNHNKYIMMHQLLYMNYYKNGNKEMDHINGKRFDNRKANLREATRIEQTQNTKLYSNNSSGYKGVSWNKIEKRWTAYITNNKKRIHLGTFTNFEDAIKARLKAQKEYFGEFNRTNEEI